MSASKISCLVYRKRGTVSFALDCTHMSLRMPQDVCRGKEVGIYHTCLPVLPGCLCLHYCEQLEAMLLSRISSLTSPISSQLRKMIVNSPCQIKRKHQGRKEGYFSRGCSGMPLISLMARYGTQQKIKINNQILKKIIKTDLEGTLEHLKGPKLELQRKDETDEEEPAGSIHCA